MHPPGSPAPGNHCGSCIEADLDQVVRGGDKEGREEQGERTFTRPGGATYENEKREKKTEENMINSPLELF